MYQYDIFLHIYFQFEELVCPRNSNGKLGSPSVGVVMGMDVISGRLSSSIFRWVDRSIISMCAFTATSRDMCNDPPRHVFRGVAARSIKQHCADANELS